MMSEPSWNTLKRQAHRLADGCCEYCQTCEANTGQIMIVDHIDPDGGDIIKNLCLCCWNCNTSKHKVMVAPDPETRDIVPLYNPRTQNWAEHFEWIDNGLRVRGLTPTGRATVARLKMNRPAAITARGRWVEGGYHPPKPKTPPDDSEN